MKRPLLLAALLAAASITHAQAAGTIPLNLTQQFSSSGVPLAGCRLYTYAAGTSTPQNGYIDSALTIAHPNPQVCDASGRLPQAYYADGAIKIRLTDSAGVQQLAADNILVIGASSGAGGGGAVDPTTVLATGDIKARYGTGTLSGFVRLNGRTIGSATSGATERANADTEALFSLLWTNDASLTVSGGRGASANADWLANKTITLPDLRGRVIAGLDDMGSTNAARLSTCGGGSITLGLACGAQTNQIVTLHLPPINYTPAGTLAITLSNPAHNHGITDPGHAHGFTDPGHNHALTDPGHNHTLNNPAHSHGITDPGHAHATTDPGHTHTVTTGNTNQSYSIGTGGPTTGFNNNFGVAGSTAQVLTSASGTTGITINSAATGITVNNATTAVSANSTTTGITLGAATTGASVNAAATGLTVNNATTAVSVASATFTGTAVALGGSSSGFPVVQPTVLMTIYIKL